MKRLIAAGLPAVLASAALAPGCTADQSVSPEPGTGAGAWTARAPLPAAMAEIGVAAIGETIYAVGGTEQVRPDSAVYGSTLNAAYDPARNVWQRIAPLPFGLSHVGVAALSGKLYAVGGFTNIVHIGPQRLAFVYDPGTNAWAALPPLSDARGSVAAAGVGGKLHVFGGRRSDSVVTIPLPGGQQLLSGFGTVTTHQVYDPATGSWSQAAPVPGPARDHMGVVVLEGKVHLFGGRTADVSDNLDRHDVYDPQTDRWSTAAPLPRPRSSGAYTVLKGRILYAGGECRPATAQSAAGAYDDVTAYDPATDRWATLTPLPGGRHAFGAATVNDVAYFVGGALACGGGGSTDVLALGVR